VKSANQEGSAMSKLLVNVSITCALRVIFKINLILLNRNPTVGREIQNFKLE